MGNCDFITRKVPEEASVIAKNIFYQQYVIGKGGYGRVK
jgi:hypothetical protein